MVEQSQREGCCCLRRDRSRGGEGGGCGGKRLRRKAREPWEQDDPAESRIGDGAITTTLSPHASIIWTVERLAHQTPDALNHRRSHPGCPFK